MSLDVHRGVTDFEYYAANFLRIRTKAREIAPFDCWYPSQLLIWRSIKKDLDAGRPIRKIILKPRQAGASTLTEALIFHQVHTVANTHALVLSMDKDSASYIFEMSRNFYESLPVEHRPMKRYSSKRELVFENPDEKTRAANPGLRSRIEVQTAGKYVPPRGANFNLVHFSEVAFWANAEDIVPAIIPMVPYLPGTMIIYESTANGVDNFFHDEWLSAKAGESAFDPIFFPWYIMSEYQLPFIDPREKRDFMKSLDDEEQELRKLYHLTAEQLKWRRFKITELNSDEDKFKQEFPCNPEEAFIMSGDPIFDRKVLRRVVTANPIWEGDIDMYNEALKPSSDGLLKIWEKPLADISYTIGVDVSSGVGSDYSCMCVLKSTWPEGLAEQVAEWHGKVDPVTLGKLCVILARYYNNAMLSIEVNNHGLTTQAEANRHYWNFYRWQYFDRIGKSYTKKVGWETNMGSKPILVDRARDCLSRSLVGISSAELLQEMWTYVKIPGSYMSFESEGGHDDRVMAFMIALTTLYIEDPSASYSVGNTIPQIVTSEQPHTRMVMQPTLGKEVRIAPIWDAKDPRGSYGRKDLDWRIL